MDLLTVSSLLDSAAGPKAPPMILIGLANKDPHNLLALDLPVTTQVVSICVILYLKAGSLGYSPRLKCHLNNVI